MYYDNTKCVVVFPSLRRSKRLRSGCILLCPYRLPTAASRHGPRPHDVFNMRKHHALPRKDRQRLESEAPLAVRVEHASIRGLLKALHLAPSRPSLHRRCAGTLALHHIVHEAPRRRRLWCEGRGNTAFGAMWA